MRKPVPSEKQVGYSRCIREMLLPRLRTSDLQFFEDWIIASEILEKDSHAAILRTARKLLMLALMKSDISNGTLTVRP